MSFRPPLTDEQVEELILDWKDGVTVPELSVIYRVSIRTVYRKLAVLDVKYRHRPRKKRKQRPVVIKDPIEPMPCGTNAGYARHKRAGEYPCALCLEAHAADVAKYRPPPSPYKRHGTDARYQRHLKDKEEACDKCKKAHSKRTSKTAKKARRKKRNDKTTSNRQ